MNQFFKILFFCWTVSASGSLSFQPDWLKLADDVLAKVYLLLVEPLDYKPSLTVAVRMKTEDAVLVKKGIVSDNGKISKPYIKIDFGRPSQLKFTFDVGEMNQVCKSWNDNFYRFGQIVGRDWLDRNFDFLYMNIALELKPATGKIVTYPRIKDKSIEIRKEKVYFFNHLSDFFTLAPCTTIVALIYKADYFFSQKSLPTDGTDRDHIDFYKELFDSIYCPNSWKPFFASSLNQIAGLFSLIAPSSLFLLPFLSKDDLMEIKQPFSNFMNLYEGLLNSIEFLNSMQDRDYKQRSGVYDRKMDSLPLKARTIDCNEKLFLNKQTIESSTILTDFSTTESALLCAIELIFFKMYGLNEYWTKEDRLLFENLKEINHKLIFFYFKGIVGFARSSFDFRNRDGIYFSNFVKIYSFLLMAAGESIRYHLKSYKLPPFESFPKINSPLNDNNFLFELFTFYKDNIPLLCKHLSDPRAICDKINELRSYSENISDKKQIVTNSMIAKNFPHLANWMALFFLASNHEEKFFDIEGYYRSLKEKDDEIVDLRLTILQLQNATKKLSDEDSLSKVQEKNKDLEERDSCLTEANKKLESDLKTARETNNRLSSLINQGSNLPKKLFFIAGSLCLFALFLKIVISMIRTGHFAL